MGMLGRDMDILFERWEVNGLVLGMREILKCFNAESDFLFFQRRPFFLAWALFVPLGSV